MSKKDGIFPSMPDGRKFVNAPGRSTPPTHLPSSMVPKLLLDRAVELVRKMEWSGVDDDHRDFCTMCAGQKPETWDALKGMHGADEEPPRLRRGHYADCPVLLFMRLYEEHG